jgi:hypothetical protein
VISDTQLPGEGAIKLQEMEEHWRRSVYNNVLCIQWFPI